VKTDELEGVESILAPFAILALIFIVWPVKWLKKKVLSPRP
jgi:hypothetical protein